MLLEENLIIVIIPNQLKVNCLKPRDEYHDILTTTRSDSTDRSTT